MQGPRPQRPPMPLFSRFLFSSPRSRRRSFTTDTNSAAVAAVEAGRRDLTTTTAWASTPPSLLPGTRAVPCRGREATGQVGQKGTGEAAAGRRGRRGLSKGSRNSTVRDRRSSLVYCVPFGSVCGCSLCSVAHAPDPDGRASLGVVSLGRGRRLDRR